MREYVRARLDANKAAWARVGAAARCIASPSWRCAAVSASLLPTDAAPRPPARRQRLRLRASAGGRFPTPAHC